MYGDGGNQAMLALYNQAMSANPNGGPRQASALQGYGGGILDAIARSGWIPGAHGATPDSFKGTNAYKAPPAMGGPAALGGAMGGGGMMDLRGTMGPNYNPADPIGSLTGNMNGSGTATAMGTANPMMLAQALRRFSGGNVDPGMGVGESSPMAAGQLAGMGGMGGMGAGRPFAGLNRTMYPPAAGMPGLQNNARRFFQF